MNPLAGVTMTLHENIELFFDCWKAFKGETKGVQKENCS